MPYFDDRYIEGVEQTYTAAEWLESIGDQKPGGGEAVSLESGEATLQIEIPWIKKRSFTTFVLGWSFADAVAPFRLRRQNPVPHPTFSWLTASTVTFQDVGPAGTASVGTRTAGAFAASLPTGKYQRSLATVRFVDRPWTFAENAAVTVETQRNVYFEVQPSIEIISAEGLNNLQFAYNPGPPNDPGGFPALPLVAIPAPFGTLMSKTTYFLNWMWVPDEFINASGPLLFRPTKIEACTGRVNSAVFMGFPINTLLMQAPQYTRFKFPILTSNNFQSYFGWNIRIPLQYFNPTLGAQAGVPVGQTFAGHQVLPFRKNLSWYPAIRDLTNKIYPEADFNTMFTHISS